MKKDTAFIRELRRKVDKVEKDKHRSEGKLEASLQALSELLGDDIPADELESRAEETLQDLKTKYEKIDKKRDRLFEKIKKESKKLGL